MGINIQSCEIHNKQNTRYLKIHNENIRKYKGLKAQFLELIGILSKRTGFCSAHDDYLMNSLNISRKTIYNYFQFFEKEGILKRQKNRYGNREIQIISSEKNTRESVNFTTPSVNFTKEDAFQAPTTQGADESYIYNNINKKTVYKTGLFKTSLFKTDNSLKEIENVFKEIVGEKKLFIQDMLLWNEITQFESYYKQRKRSRYSLKEQVEYWIENDQGVFQEALVQQERARIWKEEIQKEEKQQQEKRKQDQENCKKNLEENQRYFQILDELKQKWKEEHYCENVPINILCELSAKAELLGVS